jgi:CRISPR/Cas system-associated protein Csx1
MFILSSCEQSKKGAWTVSDKVKCQKDILTVMQTKKEEFEIMKKMFQFNELDFSECVCKKLENKYESLIVANSKLEVVMSSREGEELVLPCMGNAEKFKNMIKGDEKNESEGAEGMEEGEAAEEKAE